MKLEEIKIGIQEALLKATLAAPSNPDDHEGWADWIRWQTVYLYEFVIRSRQKGITKDEAQRLAAKAMRRQLRDEVSQQLLEEPLPQEEESDDREQRRDRDGGTPIKPSAGR